VKVFSEGKETAGQWVLLPAAQQEGEGNLAGEWDCATRDTLQRRKKKAALGPRCQSTELVYMCWFFLLIPFCFGHLCL
jgi:hypothetical protein